MSAQYPSSVLSSDHEKGALFYLFFWALTAENLLETPCMYKLVLLHRRRRSRPTKSCLPLFGALPFLSFVASWYSNRAGPFKAEGWWRGAGGEGKGWRDCEDISDWPGSQPKILNYLHRNFFYLFASYLLSCCVRYNTMRIQDNTKHEDDLNVTS